MNKKRLLILAKHLQSVSRESFNMRDWADCYTSTSHSCGTTGCAIGHAVEIPVFKRTGLRLEMNGPYFKRAYGFPAVEKFFNISETDALWLFNGNSYQNFFRNPSPKQVACRITRFLRRKNHAPQS